MMDRMGERHKLEPPEDTTIMTMYIGTVNPSMSEDDIREPFAPFGTVSTSLGTWQFCGDRDRQDGPPCVRVPCMGVL